VTVVTSDALTGKRAALDGSSDVGRTRQPEEKTEHENDLHSSRSLRMSSFRESGVFKAEISQPRGWKMKKLLGTPRWKSYIFGCVSQEYERKLTIFLR
jgi:hypothetical protein